jgi:hypothetical protein
LIEEQEQEEGRGPSSPYTYSQWRLGEKKGDATVSMVLRSDSAVDAAVDCAQSSTGTSSTLLLACRADYCLPYAVEAVRCGEDAVSIDHIPTRSPPRKPCGCS